ncbi:hypothetical protein [Ferribacterium limneticum]|uniref:hypothetical protein n=1 Tax=Ferribacterium limneticum TaxID=76259 RepID=UPI001CFA110A|nr:hypothetical protein [Ferribacterium limneticum]UCV27141.1 hypothetical protein KI617_12670 [Ferribacterium limneticum]UCV31058.1 hypothetical protein KI608_12670 [Ferribacterium limneticum]
MKLQHLAIGARFEYEGVIYVKTGPLTASSERGGARIIPRSATLKSVDVPVTEGRVHDSAGLDSGTVCAAFDVFFETCNRLVDQEQREALAKAREDFLAKLR